MGRPVVATDIPGTRQAIGDSGGDCYAPPANPVVMAERILAFLHDEAGRNESGRRNRARIEKDFSIVAMNRFFLERISEGLGKTGGAVEALSPFTGSLSR